MLFNSTHAKMNKENATIVGGGGRAKGEEKCGVRITRAKARALGGVSESSRTSFKKEHRNVSLSGSRIAVAATANRSRAVLTDVTNIQRKSHLGCPKASKFQARGGYKNKNTKLASDVSKHVLSTQEDGRAKSAQDSSTIPMVNSHGSGTTVAERVDNREPLQRCVSNGMRKGVAADLLSMQGSVKSDELISSPNPDIDMICEKLRTSDGLCTVDIDSELKDPLVWSSYAPDIYRKVCVAEHERRPLANYMEKLQQDITPGMRGVLVDWLVEVSEEYNLVPDTLYLTVNLIDRFLSKSLIEKQKLQLLGVTCLLISSKYEEICAPPVEEFCFITDNTYTKEEVLKMESEVLNLLHFQLSVPTTKTFLRRFIQAAQSSYKVPYVQLEFLANYLAELTLVEYSFLQFLPSKIAASAVLLARWTLSQSEHPWNPTMEHYTNYKVSELKITVLALADLQLNTKGCSLNTVREKNKQEKFKCVANLSLKPVQSVFQVQM